MKKVLVTATNCIWVLYFSLRVCYDYIIFLDSTSTPLHPNSLVALSQVFPNGGKMVMMRRRELISCESRIKNHTGKRKNHCIFFSYSCLMSKKCSVSCLWNAWAGAQPYLEKWLLLQFTKTLFNPLDFRGYGIGWGRWNVSVLSFLWPKWKTKMHLWQYIPVYVRKQHHESYIHIFNHPRS